MKLSAVIKKLQRLQKRTEGDIEVRTGAYNCTTETIDGIYYDDDENIIIIH